MIDIKISKESFNFTEALVEKIITQDNRMTAYPILYLIQTKKRIWGMNGDYTDKYEWKHQDDDETYSDEELKAELIESFDEEKEAFDIMDEFEFIECAENHCFSKVFYIDIEEYKENVFFTEEAAKRHISLNKHHYNNPQDYVIHAWRNPEIEKIVKVLIEVANNDR
jgi:protein tyrosine/serine phosphatase